MTIKSKNKNNAAIIGDAIGKALVPVLEAIEVIGDDKEAKCRMLRMVRGAIDSELSMLIYADDENQGSEE